MSRDNMGLDYGLDQGYHKRQNRWLFTISDVSADGTNALPPFKTGRPGFSFKEIECQHLTETVFYPTKGEFKTITLTLYEPRCNIDGHPVWNWLKLVYDPKEGKWSSPIQGGEGTKFIKSEATLELFDGCGKTIEKWKIEDIWPQSVDFGSLDMSSSDVVTCDLTLRYARAYIDS